MCSVGDSIVDRIEEDALHLEQFKTSYERKKQLLLEFSAEILGDSRGKNYRGTLPIARDGSQTRMVLGRLGGLRVLRQKLASDIAVDLKVSLIGETLDSADKLASLAMSLRNPSFETFYLFVLKWRPPRSLWASLRPRRLVGKRLPLVEKIGVKLSSGPTGRLC